MVRGVMVGVMLCALAGWAQGTESAAPAEAAPDAVATPVETPAETPAEVPVEPPAPAIVPAPVEVPAPAAKAEAPHPTFDVSQTPWGPGRRTSGEKLITMYDALSPGPFRLVSDDWSLGVGGQLFVRGDYRDNADLNAVNGDHTTNIDHRARLTVRGSAYKRVGVLVEFQDVRSWGVERSTAFNEPLAGLHQGFVDLKVNDSLNLRLGRQELCYGEDRLIGCLDWAQQARAFDGLFARYTVNDMVTVDAFGMVLKPDAWMTTAPVSGTPGRFHNSGDYFYGLYSRIRPNKTVGVDVFVLGLTQDPSNAATGLQKDNHIYTLGARGTAKLGDVALVGEGAAQVGQRGTQSVMAGAFAAKGTYTFKAWGSPYVMLETSGATGDGDATDGQWNTFNQLFPTAHAHLGYADYVGWQNVVHGRATVGIKPGGNHFWVDVHHFRFWDPRGASFNAGGAVFIPADVTRTDATLGSEVDLNFTIPVTKHFAFAGAYTLFLPGGGASNRGTAPAQWAFLYVRSQF